MAATGLSSKGFPQCLKFLVWTLVFFQVTNAVTATKPVFEGQTVLFGNLHAHSKLSDDVNNPPPGMTPLEGFSYAHRNGLDFLAITDHQQGPDTQNPLTMTAQEYKTELYDVAMAYNATNVGDFVAVPGIEWGVISQGNHLNLIGAKTIPPATIGNKEYDKIFSWAVNNVGFVQFNHPNSWKGSNNKNLAVGNYGEKLYSNFPAFVKAADPITETISIISTVKGGHLTGEHADSDKKTHREMQWENYYKEYLNQGFHISPAANQDTHSTNFGTVTAARTAVWVSSVNYDDLIKAFQKNRVYATEDDEMVVVFQVEYKGRKYWMGEVVLLEESEADVEFIVQVWQGVGSDSDSVEEGPYSVKLMIDKDGVGGTEASGGQKVSVGTKTTKRFPMKVLAGQYVYAFVTEEGGKDNPIGDGEDVVDNSTGIEGSDKKRDDLNDSAWTAPIWFIAETDKFVWSKNSSVYHDASCPLANNIKKANRRSGNTKPDGKTKHACPQ